jgi:hypothetical protein
MRERARFGFPGVLAAIMLGACTIEHAPSGRPGGPAAAAAADSVVSAEVYGALRLYYTRLTARDWKLVAQSFWPHAVITAIMGAPPGTADAADKGHVETIAIEEAIKQAAAMKDCPASYSAELTRANVLTYGPLADAWVTYRVRCGATRDSVTTHFGIDAVHFVRHGGEWRITSLTFTHEIAGAPLGRP